ncbi:MAG: prepilin peptidase [Lachnospiraceae bacterium]|nr:prepilin peptidase [Lachnospiraceae bacterium]
MSAICGAFFFGTVVYRYSLFKAECGPEEEPNRPLMSMGILDGMAAVKRDGAERWVFCALCCVSWGLTAYVYGPAPELILYGMAGVLLWGLALVDRKIFELPPELNIGIAVLGAIHLIFDLKHWYVYLIGALCVSLPLWLLALLSGGRAMGGGDIKLMAALGLLLGWQKTLLVLFIGALLGSLVHGARVLFTKGKHELAFGPYLAMGGIVAALYGQNIIDWYVSTFITIN